MPMAIQSKPSTVTSDTVVVPVFNPLFRYVKPVVDESVMTENMIAPVVEPRIVAVTTGVVVKGVAKVIVPFAVPVPPASLPYSTRNGPRVPRVKLLAAKLLVVTLLVVMLLADKLLAVIAFALTLLQVILEAVS